MSLFERVRKIDNYFKKANKKKTTTNKTKKLKKNPQKPQNILLQITWQSYTVDSNQKTIGLLWQNVSLYSSTCLQQIMQY